MRSGACVRLVFRILKYYSLDGARQNFSGLCKRRLLHPTHDSPYADACSTLSLRAPCGYQKRGYSRYEISETIPVSLPRDKEEKKKTTRQDFNSLIYVRLSLVSNSMVLQAVTISCEV